MPKILGALFGKTKKREMKKSEQSLNSNTYGNIEGLDNKNNGTYTEESNEKTSLSTENLVESGDINDGDNEKIQSKEITQKTNDEIEKVLYECDLDKIKYFIRRFFLENIGKEPKLSVKSNSINIDFDMFKPKIPVSNIVLYLIKEVGFEFDKIDYTEVLKGDFFAIRFSSYNYLEFEIIPLKSVDENFLKEIKKILEEYFVPYLENMNEYKFTEEEIAKILELEADDKLSFLDDKLDILLKIKNFDNIDTKSIMLIANSIANLGDYLLKIENSWGAIYLYIVDESNNYSYRVTFKRDNKLLINIEPRKYETKITRKFLQGFVKFLISYIKELANQDENFIDNLKSLGVRVEKYPRQENINQLFIQKGFVGYDDIKEKIITHIINPWKNKRNYENFVKEKLPNLKNIIPNAVLFYGVPGTGKTTMASIIGEYLGYPFVYIPINSIMSKWFGESENRLNKILETCGKLAEKEGGVVIMIDEIDEIGKNREKTSSDASNRILGVLLKKLDGLERLDNILLIGGTNLPDSLDSALLSRFSQKIEFRLPNEKEIVDILKYYLSSFVENKDLTKIASKLKGKSGRDIKKISEDFARYVIKNNINGDYLQELEKFLDI